MADAGRTVLIAVDASEHSRSAFQWYLDNVHKPTDLILVVHIMDSPKLPAFCIKDGLKIPAEEWSRAITESITKAQKLEMDFEAELISKKLKYKTRFEGNYKDAGHGICSLAEAEDANLIVMGTRGLDVIRRTLLGSVSDYVVRHSHVPVLICPTPK